MSYVSAREFSKKLEELGYKRSNVWISKMVKAGKLPSDSTGKIPLEEGLEAFKASQQVGYDKNRENAEKQRTKSGTTKPNKAKGAEVNIPDNDDMPATVGGAMSQAKLAEAFNKARTAEKTYQAKLKEMEYKLKQGELLSRDDVVADAKASAEEFRSLLMTIPPRLARLCEAKTAREIEVLIEREINEALKTIQKSRFLKGDA